MNQMELLWQYMQADVKADSMAANPRHAQARQKAEQARDRYFALRKRYEQMTQQLDNMTDRYETIQEAIRREQEQLTALIARHESLIKDEGVQADDIAAALKDIERHMESLSGYEKELTEISVNAQTISNQVGVLSQEAAKAHADFKSYKAAMEAAKAEGAGKKAAADQLRAEAEKIAQQLDPSLLTRYQAIKRNIPTPVARLDRGNCSGCNTGLPSALRSRIDSNNEIIECETCGRMLVKK